MTSSRNGILRGVAVDGVTFCSPTGRFETESSMRSQESDSLKALEKFWYSKGRQEGQDAGFDAGYQEGEAAGLRKGLEEGEAKGRQEGETAGYERGYQEAKDGTEQLFADGLKHLEQLKLGLQEERESLFNRVKPELIRFALLVCERILREKLNEPEVTQKLIISLLEQVRPAFRNSHIQVVLPESTHKSILERKADLNDKFGDLDLSFVADPQLKDGDYRIESDQGMLHFNLERQLEELERCALASDETPEPTPTPDLQEQDIRDPDLPPAESPMKPLTPGEVTDDESPDAT